MPRAKLTDLGLQSLKPPATGHLDLWDTTLPTFGVRVSPKGTRTFILKLNNGRRSLGRWPQTKLADARAAAKKLLAQKTLHTLRPEQVSFADARTLFMEDCRRKNRPGTLREYGRILNGLDFPGPLSDLSITMVARKLDGLTEGQRLHVLVTGKVFGNWAVRRQYLDRNPFAPLTFQKYASRSRVLSDEELGRIWRACDQTGDTASAGGAVGERVPSEVTSSAPRLPTNFCTIVKLLILTGQRRGEITALRGSYYSHNQQTICLPGTLTKNKKEHTLPTGALAGQLLIRCLPELPTQTTLLFPARGRILTSFSGFGKAKAQLDKLSAVTNWKLHDLRRTFATRLSELGTPPHVVERLLNHISGQISGVAAVYNRASYMSEMRQAIEAWETYLLQRVIILS